MRLGRARWSTYGSRLRVNGSYERLRVHGELKTTVRRDKKCLNS